MFLAAWCLLFQAFRERKGKIFPGTVGTAPSWWSPELRKTVAVCCNLNFFIFLCFLIIPSRLNFWSTSKCLLGFKIQPVEFYGSSRCSNCHLRVSEDFAYAPFRGGAWCTPTSRGHVPLYTFN